MSPTDLGPRLDQNRRTGSLAPEKMTPNERRDAAREIQERLQDLVAKVGVAEELYDSRPTVENMDRMIEAREDLRHAITEGSKFLLERAHG